MSVNEKMTAIADAIRAKTGGTEALTLDGMAEAIASIEAGGNNVMDAFLAGEMTEYVNDTVEKLSAYALAHKSTLKRVSLPAVIYQNSYTFSGCSVLEELDMLKADTVCTGMINNCNALKKLCLQSAANISNQGLSNAKLLEIVDLPALLRITGTYVLRNSTAFKALVLRASTVVTVSNEFAFTNSTIESGTGYVYVPAALVEEYKAADNWSTYAAQFRALEDYTVDGTITGELDESKI